MVASGKGHRWRQPGRRFFRHVTLPLLSRSIALAFGVCFVLSLSEFATFHLAGVKTIGTELAVLYELTGAAAPVAQAAWPMMLIALWAAIALTRSSQQWTPTTVTMKTARIGSEFSILGGADPAVGGLVAGAGDSARRQCRHMAAFSAIPDAARGRSGVVAPDGGSGGPPCVFAGPGRGFASTDSVLCHWWHHSAGAVSAGGSAGRLPAEVIEHRWFNAEPAAKLVARLRGAGGSLCGTGVGSAAADALCGSTAIGGDGLVGWGHARCRRGGTFICRGSGPCWSGHSSW